MRINNTQVEHLIINDEAFFPNIQFVRCTYVDKSTIDCFKASVKIVHDKLIADGYKLNDLPPVAIVFSEDGEFTVSEDNKTMGCHMHIISLPVGRWNKNNYNTIDRTTIIFEELCHCFYNVSNESQVKEIVMKMWKILNPDMTREKAYAKFYDPDRD